MPPIAHVINIRVKPAHRIQGAVLRTSRERLIRLTRRLVSKSHEGEHLVLASPLYVELPT